MWVRQVAIRQETAHNPARAAQLRTDANRLAKEVLKLCTFGKRA